MIFPTSLTENVTVDRHLSVVTSAGRELLLGIREHCLEKKILKSWAFSLKSVMKWFSWNSGGIIGVFLRTFLIETNIL